ncbi:hypothetical protein ACQ4M4_09490 [Leptolyngbya sp. AN02str]|uniref:hypothetical protein n=1 Tax=Leptolyngbya sp. AN02str TaxID=3423363 RepID=UPI003D31154C
MNYRIRLARLEELPAFNAIERAAAQRFCGTAFAFIASSEPMPEAAIAPYIHQGRAWVAVDKADEPVGWAIAQVLGQQAHL